tara:strand:+ start:707 stop:1240 length:534 start_codon:yes stop_codon:yes gene_type:complete
MLGLGVNLAGRKGKRIVYKYVSDFSDSYDAAVDLIVADSVQGTLTFTANVDSTLDGEANDWLKAEFDTNQTDGISGVKLNIADEISNGDLIKIDYKIYIDNSSNKWGPNNNIFTSSSVGGINSGGNVIANQVSNVSRTITASANNAGVVLAAWAVNEDKPEAGAIFYLKDVIVTVTR